MIDVCPTHLSIVEEFLRIGSTLNLGQFDLNERIPDSQELRAFVDSEILLDGRSSSGTIIRSIDVQLSFRQESNSEASVLINVML